MKRVIIYLRVSTNNQAEEGYSIEIQKERLLAFCQAHGWVVVEIITDPGYSGSDLNRPGIQKVIHRVENKNTDIVLVYNLSRLSRSQKDTLYLIEDVFLPAGVDFVSMQESFDTSTSFGRAMVGILSVFAQLERETIKDRTFSGRVERAKDGLWHGGGYDPIGYDYIDGQLQINTVEAPQVRRVFDMYASGASITEIRDRMVSLGFQTKHGDWSHINTVRSVLDNELYTGTVHFDGSRSEGEAHTAIISRSLFDQVSRLRSKSKQNRLLQVESEYLLTSFLTCGICGARYFPKKNRSGNTYYHCHSRAKVNITMVKDPTCLNNNWKQAELEAIVEAEIMKIATDREYLMASRNKKRATEDCGSAAIREELASLEVEIKALMDSYRDTVSVDEVSKNISELYSRKVELSSLISENESEKIKTEAIPDSVLLLLRDVPFTWNDGGVRYRRFVLRSLLDTVEVHGEDVHFVWSF